MANTRSTPAGPTLTPKEMLAILEPELAATSAIANTSSVPHDVFGAWSSNLKASLIEVFGPEGPQTVQFNSILAGVRATSSFTAFGMPAQNVEPLNAAAVSSAYTLLETSIKRLRARASQPPANAMPQHSEIPMPKSVFIVHGHDELLKNQVARFVNEQCGLTSILLAERASGGRTIIEKFEGEAADVGFAIVLLTPDDVGGVNAESPTLKRRARQNVILELGYFIGKLSRKRVCALYMEGVEMPSDIHGVVYISAVGDWRFPLFSEMRQVWPDLAMRLP